MARTRKLTVEILGDASSLSKAFRGINQETQTLGDKFRSFTKKAVIPATAALAGIGAAAVKFTLAAEKTATANARLGQILSQMGYPEATDRVIAFSKQLEKTVAIDENVIKLTQAKLATFANLTKTIDQAGGAFDRATLAAIDLAAAGFGSAESNAVQLGKALQDPIKGIAALARSGVTFTEQEKAKIKTLVESNKMLEAQDVILSAIEKQVGGTAEATANNSDRMRLAFQEVQETIGAALLPAFERLLPVLQRFADWAAANPQLIIKVGAAIAALSAAIITLNFLLSINPYVLLTAAIVALGTAMYVLYQRSEPARKVMHAIGLFILSTAVPAFTIFAAVVYGLGRAFQFLWNNMSKPLNALKNFNWKGAGLGSLLGGLAPIPGGGLLGGLLGGLRNAIPGLATGGIVTRPTLAMIGEGGGPEAVIPLDRMGDMGGGGDTYVTINVQGADPNAVVAALRKYLANTGPIPIRVTG